MCNSNFMQIKNSDAKIGNFISLNGVIFLHLILFSFETYTHILLQTGMVMEEVIHIAASTNEGHYFTQKN